MYFKMAVLSMWCSCCKEADSKKTFCFFQANYLQTSKKYVLKEAYPAQTRLLIVKMPSLILA